MEAVGISLIKATPLLLLVLVLRDVDGNRSYFVHWW
jgi:hypothetical protein